mmetsp:Transcript_7169/g.8233  ORF Transcript_7169/g.8233 Transcript_7169/m.8233 type:complete len:643 (-) Transcript_7169:154-2082(-)|eukprot:CAMPEP_0184020324 /NCGR_PEP_ID=MMETSP0954-20121128/9284_1 /TAXON_ID=627963 /ORGANISM="Aplanochytrium sp, Strain PBS07" /LENGTH=642 /DNA_ID=CAMNT_0026302169 /DNA_START=79 /DNA_END=2007 /DNA_ORIENTATION=+
MFTNKLVPVLLLFFVFSAGGNAVDESLKLSNLLGEWVATDVSLYSSAALTANRGDSVTSSWKPSKLLSTLALAQFKLTKNKLNFGPQLEVEGPELVLDGKAIQVKVKWKGIKYATSEDIIGVFSCYDEACSNSALTERSPIQFKNVHGKKELSFTILIRSDSPAYELVYMGGTKHFVEILAVSDPIVIPDSLWEIPQHLRLSLVGDEIDKMRVMWTEPSRCFHKVKRAPPVVYWGTVSKAYSHKTTPMAVYTYDRTELCERDFHPAGSSGFSSPGFQFEAILSNLKPETVYYYAISGRKEEFSFLSPPALGTATPSKMIVMGDVGQSMFPIDESLQHSFDNDEHGEVQAPKVLDSITRIVQNEKISLVNHIGDISYATGQLALWDNFLYEIEPVASKLSWMVGIGNHEMGWQKSDMAGSDSLGECGVPYAAFFPYARLNPIKNQLGKLHFVKHYPMSRSQALENEALWNPFYSYKYGNVHVIMMSTEHTFEPGSVQHRWIQNELACVNRTVTPWVLFLGHRPMYVSDKYPAPVTLLLQKYIDPLLFQHSVDVAIWGHHHSYQRPKCKLFQGQCHEKGTLHIVSGLGGFAHTEFGSNSSDIWAVRNNKVWGVSVLDFKNSTHLNITFVEHEDDTIIDQVWVTK